MKKNRLKPINIHSSFKEMRLWSTSFRELEYAGRLAEMHRLNCKVFGEDYGSKVSKTIEIYSSHPGEDVNQFYKRINQDG